jgi:CheY-like chemotaxis protein
LTSNKYILLVEDNPDDEQLALRAFRKSSLDHRIEVVRDGAEALEYLFYFGRFSDRKRNTPTVVLLDLKLPKVDGLEVLRQLRAEDSTRLLPVVVLTSSSQDEDIRRSYVLGANSYVRKPVDFNQFKETIERVSTYWMTDNVSPRLKGME